MVKIRQNRFTAGWLEPKAVALNDYEAYLAGAAEMTNVVCLPEGGFKLRYSFEYLNTAHNKVERIVGGTLIITTPNGGVGANANDDDPATLLTTTTAIGVNNPYVVVHYDLGALANVAFVDVVAATLSVGANADEFFIQASVDDVLWVTLGAAISMSTTATTQRRRVMGSYRYFRFVRIGATNLGTATVSIGEFNVWKELPEISSARLIRYKFNIDQRYVLLLTDRNIAVYRDGVFQVDLRANLITEDKLSKINWAYGGDKILICHEGFDVQEITRQGADDNWTVETWQPENIPYYDFVPIKVLPATTLTPDFVSGLVTLTAGAATFSAADVNQIIEGNGGRVRITAYTSPTVVKGVTEVPFYTTTAIAANDWNIQRGFEPMWSATRGYIRSLAFFQQRLYIGGMQSRPRTLIGSVVGSPFNFDKGFFRDSDGFYRDFDNEEPIVNLLAHRSLNLFTTGGESSVIIPRGVALTPETIQFFPQTEVGSEYGLRPVVSNGVIMFVQRGGNSLIELVFDENQQAFTASNVSLLASHLIRTPVDFDIRRSTSANEADMLLIVNSDGTLTNGVFMNEENVRGFTLTATDGLITSVCADEEDIYFVVQRTINGQQIKYFEKANYTILGDCSKRITTGLPTNTFNGLDHLEGRVVNVFADGVYLNDQTVVNGQITTEVNVNNYIDIGLNFTPTVKTLPFEALQLVGEKMGEKKRITSCYIWFYQTSAAVVNNVPVSFRGFNDQLLDRPLPVFTGIHRIEGLRGWDAYGQVVLTQTKPTPMTVLAMRMEASV